MNPETNVIQNMSSYQLYWNDDDRKLFPLPITHQLQSQDDNDVMDLGEELKRFWDEWDNRYLYDDVGEEDDNDTDEYSNAFWERNYCRNDSYCTISTRQNSYSDLLDSILYDDRSGDETDSDASDCMYYGERTSEKYFYM